jgi:hypothetical protein
MLLWWLKMDPWVINVIVSLLSAVLMFGAIIFMLIYVVGTLSSKSGTLSLRIVVGSLLYFFGSTFFLIKGVEWVSEMGRLGTPSGSFSPFQLNIGASALGFTAVLHIFCGILTAFLYLQGQGTLGNIRHRLRARK